MLTIGKIIEKIIIERGFKFEKELQSDIGIGKGVLTLWKERNTLKKELIEYLEKHDLSLDEFISGKEGELVKDKKTKKLLELSRKMDRLDHPVDQKIIRTLLDAVNAVIETVVDEKRTRKMRRVK